MEIERTGTIEYKIFKQRDLKNLADFFIKIKEELNHDDTNLQLKIEFEDGTSIKGFDLSVLEDTKSKTVKAVHFNLSNYHLKKYLDVHISILRSSYEVVSSEKDWVDAKFTQLAEIIRKTQNQNYWLSNNNRQMLLSTSIGLTLGILFYLFVFRRLFINKDIPITEFSTFLLVLISLVVGQSITALSMDKLYKLYPSIDFDTSLDHLNRNKNKKATVRKIFTLIILPLTISYISVLLFS